MANDDEGEDQQGAPYPAFKPLPEGRGFPPFVGESVEKMPGRKGKSLTAPDILGQPDEAITGSSEALAAGAAIGASLPKSYLRGIEIPRSLLSDGISGRLAELSNSESALAKQLRESADWSARLSKQFEPLQRHLEPPSFLDAIGRAGYKPDLEMPRLAEMPRNPIHDTNEKLETLVDRIEALHELTEATAEVHAKQSAMVSELVAATVASARALEESSKDVKRSHWITIISLLVAVFAALPSLFGENGLWPIDTSWTEVTSMLEAVVYDILN